LSSERREVMKTIVIHEYGGPEGRKREGAAPAVMEQGGKDEPGEVLSLGKPTQSLRAPLLRRVD
jgi:hypothetical protein